MTRHEGATRRDVLRGGALGVGALVGASTAVTLGSDAAAATYDPRVTAGLQWWLKMDGVKGDGTGIFKNLVRVLTFTIDFDANSDGVRELGPFTFTSPTGKGTRDFLVNLGASPGTNPASAIGYREGTKGPEPYLYITLKKPQVTAVHIASHGLAIDTVTIAHNGVVYAVDGSTVIL